MAEEHEGQQQEDATADLAALESELAGEIPVTAAAEGDAGSGAGEGTSGAEGKQTQGAADGSKPVVGVGTGQPTEEKYKVGDREYTLDELVKGGHLKNLVTTASMAAHHQKLAADREARTKELEARLAEQDGAKAGAAAETPAGPSHVQKRAMVAPFVQSEIVEKGAWGPEWAEIAKEMPEVAADLVIDRIEREQVVQIVDSRLQRLEKAFEAIHTTAATYEEQAAGEEFRGRYEGWLNALAAEEHGAYNGLKDPAHRQAFNDYVAVRAKDLDIRGFTADDVRELYWGFLAKLDPSALVRLKAQADTAAAGRSLAAGEGAGKRSAPAGETELERVERELSM